MKVSCLWLSVFLCSLLQSQTFAQRKFSFDFEFTNVKSAEVIAGNRTISCTAFQPDYYPSSSFLSIFDENFSEIKSEEITLDGQPLSFSSIVTAGDGKRFIVSHGQFNPFYQQRYSVIQAITDDGLITKTVVKKDLNRDVAIAPFVIYNEGRYYFISMEASTDDLNSMVLIPCSLDEGLETIVTGDTSMQLPNSDWYGTIRSVCKNISNDGLVLNYSLPGGGDYFFKTSFDLKIESLGSSKFQQGEPPLIKETDCILQNVENRLFCACSYDSIPALGGSFHHLMEIIELDVNADTLNRLIVPDNQPYTVVSTLGFTSYGTDLLYSYSKSNSEESPNSVRFGLLTSDLKVRYQKSLSIPDYGLYLSHPKLNENSLTLSGIGLTNEFKFYGTIVQIIDPENHVFEKRQSTIIKMFPNPVGSDLNVEVSAEDDLSIIDGLGRVVAKHHLKVGTNNIQLHLSPGHYTAIWRESEHFKFIMK